jgi:hypothetical protein
MIFLNNIFFYDHKKFCLKKQRFLLKKKDVFMKTKKEMLE